MVNMAFTRQNADTQIIQFLENYTTDTKIIQFPENSTADRPHGKMMI